MLCFPIRTYLKVANVIDGNLFVSPNNHFKILCRIKRKGFSFQRAGRAGRTRPGKCYRLCTKEAFSKVTLSLCVAFYSADSDVLSTADSLIFIIEIEVHYCITATLKLPCYLGPGGWVGSHLCPFTSLSYQLRSTLKKSIQSKSLKKMKILLFMSTQPITEKVTQLEDD